MVDLPIRRPLYPFPPYHPLSHPVRPVCPSHPVQPVASQFVTLYQTAHKIQFLRVNRIKPIQYRVSSEGYPNKPLIMQPVNSIHTNTSQDVPTYYKDPASSEKSILSCLSYLSINIWFHIYFWLPLIWFFNLPRGLCRQTFALLLSCFVFYCLL